MVAESWEYPYLTFNTNVLSKIKLYDFLVKQKFLKKYIKISTPEVFGSAKSQVQIIKNIIPLHLMHYHILLLKIICFFYLKNFHFL